MTPPYLAPTTTGATVLQGVNYASGGGGILNHTGKIFVSSHSHEIVYSTTVARVFIILFLVICSWWKIYIYMYLWQGGRINLDAQLDNFANTRQAIISSIGENAATNLFQNAFYSITIGSNDFINNYLTPVVSKVEQDLVSPESFTAAMIARFRTQLTVTSFPLNFKQWCVYW